MPSFQNLSGVGIVERASNFHFMKKILVLLLLFPAFAFGQQQDQNPKFKPFLSSGFNLLAHNGLWGTTPAYPDGDPRPLNYTGLGYGVDLDYHVMKYLAVHFDINAYSRRTPLAKKGGYATSDWVWEMDNYNQRLIGPFDRDMYYAVRSAGMRLGVKGYPFPMKYIQPWIGLYYGYYTYTIGVFSKDNKSTLGNTTGSLWEFSYFNAGVDFWTKDRSFGASVYCEFGSPVARNFKITNCLHDGWTYQDYGEGLHLYGFNRVGISLLFSLTKSK
jgi:hypothetical protein